MIQNRNSSYKRKTAYYRKLGIEKRTDKSLQRELIGLFLLGIVTVVITGFCLKLLHTHILVEKIKDEGFNYESFREMKLDEDAFGLIKSRTTHLLKHNPSLKNIPMVDEYGYLTVSMLFNDFDLEQKKPVDEQTFLRGIGSLVSVKEFQELYEDYKAVLNDLEYFPVPRMEEADISYENSWYEPRTYGGKRKHEGTDLMASNNQRGYFPIISMTNGVVEKIGWLEQGGYRIGIRSESGAYYYYAHLYSYAPEIEPGDGVIAGQLLGFMGDSGYGPEGTTGQFDVHLHMGIYLNSGDEEVSVNPFWILKILENYRTNYDYQ
jgi:peptidoglycan LD-endopeptidase LytH